MSTKEEQNESPLISPTEEEKIDQDMTTNDISPSATDSEVSPNSSDSKPKKRKFIILSLITLSGILTITTSACFSSLIQKTALSLLYIFGAFLSSPVFALFFEIYHCFIPPFFPDICHEGALDDKEIKDQTEKADAGD